MADLVTATQRRQEDKEEWLMLQKAARKEREENSDQELRDLQFHPDPSVAAGACDEMNLRKAPHGSPYTQPVCV